MKSHDISWFVNQICLGNLHTQWSFERENLRSKLQMSSTPSLITRGQPKLFTIWRGLKNQRQTNGLSWDIIGRVTDNMMMIIKSKTSPSMSMTYIAIRIGNGMIGQWVPG